MSAALTLRFSEWMCQCVLHQSGLLQEGSPTATRLTATWANPSTQLMSMFWRTSCQEHCSLSLCQSVYYAIVLLGKPGSLCKPYLMLPTCRPAIIVQVEALQSPAEPQAVLRTESECGPAAEIHIFGCSVNIRCATTTLEVFSLGDSYSVN